MKNFFIIHYNEIGLKGKNRNFFEDKLIFNIKQALKHENFDFVKKISGRLILKLNEKSDEAVIKNKLQKIFGVAYFCEACLSSQKLEVLQKDVWGLMRNYLKIVILKEVVRPTEESSTTSGGSFASLKMTKASISFKIETQRSNKNYPLTSQEINEKIGAYVLENFNKLIVGQAFAPAVKVNLKNPDITCFIEIVEKYAFIYFEKIKSAGGLPSGTSGKIISLISSGFDSPVASYFLMKRGAKIIFVHFESTPQTSTASLENVKELVKKLTEYQFSSKLYLVPFLEIQKEIIKNCKLDLAVILYRRMMVRIANEIAKKEGGRALATGDNLGQVASQTLENIEAINKVSEFPIFRPLIGFDKEEIINFARKISTYEISSQPYEDCCSLFIPRHPQTRARIEEVENEEKKIKIEKLIQAALEKTKIEEFYC